MSHLDDSHADDLQPVVDMLRANRPEATAFELDSVKQRVRARVAPGRRARSANLMKSRLAILGMLVTGMLASTAGVGLAIDGLSSNDASIAQYGGVTPTPTTTTPTPTPTTTTTTPGGNNKPPGGVLGEGQHHNGNGNNSHHGGNAPNGGNNTSPLQPGRQVETGAAGSGQLPFTGFLAIPVLIGGIVLLSAGLVLRRRATRDDQS